MIETPARAKNVSQPDRNIQFWQKFFSREYTQSSNLPCLIQFQVVGSLSSKLSFTKDGHGFSVVGILLDEPLDVWNVHQFSEY